jgi:hypothetical protein
LASRGTFTISRNPVALGPLGAQFVDATLTSASFALWAYADLATIGQAGAMGMLSWAGYALMIYVGVAAGATLGTYLGRPIADQLRRFPTPASSPAIGQ